MIATAAEFTGRKSRRPGPTRQARRGRWILGRASSARAACRGQLDSFLTNGFNKCLRRSNLPKTRFGIKKPVCTDFIKNQKTSRFFYRKSNF
jgi:hypothetical protein